MAAEPHAPGGRATLADLRDMGVNVLPVWRDDPDAITAATVLGIRRSLVLQMAKTGDLKTIKLGNKRLVPVEALAALLGGEEP